MQKHKAYYNEIDPKCCAWLQALMDKGLIMAGKIDNRSIYDVSPDDLRGFTRVGFFAGIGGWDLALQLAGWPEDRPVWHGSCPCQPFSSAGKGLGDKDERHLWPVFFNLIKECRPQHVFGEQVASAIGKGWLDGVSTDLESENYAIGSVVLGAHSVSAPHIRQRLYWLADFGSQGLQRHWQSGEQPMEERWEGKERHTWTSGTRDHRLVQSNSDGCEQRSVASTTSGHRHSTQSAGSWDDYRLANCRDGKSRRIPTEPAFFPLAHGISARVVRLRGYGNAIVPQVASEFVKAYLLTLTH